MNVHHLKRLRYDFETTIGEDFLETVRQIEANKKGVALDQITVDKLSFDLEYRAPVVVPWWYDFLPYLIMLVIMAVIWFVTASVTSRSGRNSNTLLGAIFTIYMVKTDCRSSDKFHLRAL